jgi:CRP-like cAMP-binding protein
VILDGHVAVHILKIDPGNLENPEQVIEVAEIKNGLAFGDYALLHNDRRGASIFVKKNSHFLVLYKPKYMEILGKAETQKLKDKLNFLQTLPLFHRWTDRKLMKNSYAFEVRYLARNHTLFSEGEPCDFVYIVKEGEFQLMKNCRYMKRLTSTRKVRQTPILKAKVKQVQVAIVGKGEMLGEDDALNEQAYSTTCKCFTTAGVILEISVKNFFKRIVNRDTLKILRESIETRVKGREDRLTHYKTLESSTEHRESPSPSEASRRFKSPSSSGLKSVRILKNDRTLDSPVSTVKLRSANRNLDESSEFVWKSFESAKDPPYGRYSQSPVLRSKAERSSDLHMRGLRFSNDVEVLRKIFPLVRNCFSRTKGGIKLHRVQEGLVIRSQTPVQH